jgi:predicted nucleotide-binding protein
MDDVLDDLVLLIRRCDCAELAYEDEPFKSQARRLLDAVAEVEKAWSGGWVGYQANVYIKDLQPRRPDEHFDTFSGDSAFNETRGRWVIYDPDVVREAIMERAQVPDLEVLKVTATLTEMAFREAKNELLPTIDALLVEEDDPAIRSLREQVASLESHTPAQQLFEFLARQARPTTQDLRAISGPRSAPPHLDLQVRVLSLVTYKTQLQKMSEHASYLATYLRKRRKMKGRTVAKTSGKIFIGHGRSAVWRDLRDFVRDRLELEWEEFNRESPAGLSTKERLEAMLDNAVFAFLVMTAEDETADHRMHARANVIHEAGLFQGRLGFQRAIVLLEDGCEEFSNIVGLGQIRFAKGELRSKSEEIRQVLEREKLI